MRFIDGIQRGLPPCSHQSCQVNCWRTKLLPNGKASVWPGSSTSSSKSIFHLFLLLPSYAFSASLKKNKTYPLPFKRAHPSSTPCCLSSFCYSRSFYSFPFFHCYNLILPSIVHLCPPQRLMYELHEFSTSVHCLMLLHWIWRAKILLKSCPYLKLAGSQAHADHPLLSIVQGTTCSLTPQHTGSSEKYGCGEAYGMMPHGTGEGGACFLACRHSATFQAALQLLRLASQQAPEG